MERFRNMLKGPLAVALMLLSAPACLGQNYYLGLGGYHTTDLCIYGDTIYAGTCNGIYKKNVVSPDTNWIPCGMQGNHVVQIVVADPMTFLAVVEIGSTKRTRLHKSTDGGNTFTLLLPDTSEVNNYQYLDHIACLGNGPDTIYSLFHRKRTFDGGASWLPISASSIRFIKVHPLFHNQVFMGGETMMFSAELKCSYDYASTFATVPMTGYFAGDNSVHDLEFAGPRWIAVGEGVISYTENQGNSWTQAINTWSYPLQWRLYILDIEKSSDNTLYASGESGNSNRVCLFVSHDCGTSWDTLSFRSFNNGNPSIKCIALSENSEAHNLFLGGEGIYLYRTPISGNNEAENPGIPVFVCPNPSPAGSFFIHTLKNDISVLSWSVSDPAGRIIASGNDQTVTLQHPGAYLLKINTDKGTVIRKILSGR